MIEVHEPVRVAELIMDHPFESYSEGIRNKYPRYAAWPPNIKLKVGDIGVLEGELFQYRSTLGAMGVRFTTRGYSPKDDRYVYSGYSFTAELAANADAIPGVGTASAKLGFASKGSYVFEASGCSEDEIEDKIALANQLKELMERGLWDKNWFVIQSIMRAERATIILAYSNGGELTISAEGGFGERLPLAGAKGALAIKAQSGDFIRHVAEEGLTPMFDLLTVKPSFWEKVLDAFRRREKVEPITRAEEALEWYPQ
jgi:hypothetical protein